MDGYQHYVRIDANSVIIYGFSSAFETPEPADICIDEDAGRHFTLQIRNERNQSLYKYVDGVFTDRSQTELDAEWNARPPAPETDAQKIARMEAEKVVQAEQIANINRDFGEFVDFFFANNPQLS